MNVEKLIDERDFKKSIELSDYAFQRGFTEEEKELRLQRMQENLVLGIKKEEELAANLQVLSSEVCINGEYYSMGGIASVGSYPEHRRGGLVTKLLEASFVEMRKMGQVISYLHPFKVSFYRKYGYEVFADEKQYTIENVDLKRFQEGEGHIVRLSFEESLPALQFLYKKVQNHYSGTLNRTEKWWRERIYKEGDYYIVCKNKDNQEEGYLRYEINNRTMIVHEYVSITIDAKKSIWNFICQHDSMVDKVTIKAAKSDILAHLLDNPRIEQKIWPYFMARIIDVEKFLSLYKLSTKRELLLNVQDSSAPWNEGTYAISDGKVEKLKDGEQGGLKLSVGPLTAILLGYVTPIDLYYGGQIHGDISDVEQLQEAVRNVKQTYFLDFF